MSGSFATSWASLGDVNPFETGTGTLEPSVDGMELAVTQVGSMAGFDPDVQGGSQPAIRVVALLDDATFAVVILTFDPGSFAAGSEIAFDWATAFGVLVRYDLAARTTTVLGILDEGAVRLDEASTEPDAVVSGDFDAQLRSFPLL